MARNGAVSDRLTHWNRRFGPVFASLKERALAAPWDGQGLPTIDALRLPSPEEPGKILSVLLTFDHGAHASGWFRNSQYDRCWHMSLTVLKPKLLSFGLPGFETPTRAELDAVGRLIFGEDLKKTRIEPPTSAFDRYRTAPQSRHTYHVRLYVDRQGNPIVPGGEVYTLIPWEDGTSPEKVFR